MTRTKATLWGALFGGVIGPAMGGVLLTLYWMNPLARNGMSRLNLSDLETITFMALVASMIPGVILGGLGSLWLTHLERRTERIAVAGLLGAAAVVAVLISDQIAHPFADLSGLFRAATFAIPAFAAGGIVGAMFPKKWVTPRPAQHDRPLVHRSFF